MQPDLLTSGQQETPMARPQSQHRTSTNSIPSSNLPIRSSTSRHHSHTISLGTNHSSHRVSRRKSMTSGIANSAAILRAAVNGNGENLPGTMGQIHRRSLPVKQSGSHQAALSMPGEEDGGDDEALLMDTSFDDNLGYQQSTLMDSSGTANSLLPPGQGGLSSKGRARRASEGSHLSKGENKRASGELRCEKCGKGYKHSSCLTKHLSVFLPFLHLSFAILITSSEACLVSALAYMICSNDRPLFRRLRIPKSSLTQMQMGAHARMVLYFKVTYLQAPTSSIARSCVGACWHESRRGRDAGFGETP